MTIHTVQDIQLKLVNDLTTASPTMTSTGVCVCVICSILICTQGQVNRSVREDKRLVYKTKCVIMHVDMTKPL